MSAEDEHYKKIVASHGQDSVTLKSGNVSKELRWALMAASDTWIISSLSQGYSLVPDTE